MPAVPSDRILPMGDVNINERLLVQIGSYNTNLQAGAGLPQDLVDWLAPTFQVSAFLSKKPRAPDIVAIGFQELLPLHLGLAGRSKPVIDERDAHIRSQIEAHAPNKESYSLVAKVANVGVALFVYAKDDAVARYISDVQTQWTGSGPAYMGNKGAVGVRFRVAYHESEAGEVFTFVCAHLTAHEAYLKQRVADYHHIVRTLLFPASPLFPNEPLTTMYATSHLFFLGDLNFRVSVPPSHPLRITSRREEALSTLTDEKCRETLKEYDQLINECRSGRAFIGLREGTFWSFKCTYKYVLGEIDKYSPKRTPSWTDRILYTTYADSPDAPDKSEISNVLYTSIPSYVTSDHKPVVALLLLPVSHTLPGAPSSTLAEAAPQPVPPRLRLPSTYTPTPDPLASAKRYIGRTLDRIIGYSWWFFIIIGAGSTVVGIFNFLCVYASWKWLGRWWWGLTNGNNASTVVDTSP